MKTALLLLMNAILCVACISCADTTNSTPNTPTSSTLTMQQLTDLPRNGGDVKSVAFLDDNTIVAAMDDKLVTIPVSGGAPTVVQPNVLYESIVVGANKEIYALTNDALWVLDNINAPPRKTTVFQRNGQTLNVYLSTGPNGQPYLRILSYPTVMQLWTSKDNGQNWIVIDVPTKAEYGGGLAFGPANEMYLSSPFSFYASKDNGTTWKKYPPVVANYGGELIKRKNGDILYYIPSGGGLWSSSNEGATFTNITPFNANPFYSKIIEANDGTLYSLSTTTGSNTLTDKPFRLMRSTTNGATWEHVLFAQGRDFAMRGSTIVVGLGASGSGGVAISQNSGTSFISAGMRAAQNITSFGFDKDGNLIILADNGFYHKIAGQWETWGSFAYTKIATTPQGNIYLPGTGTSFLTKDNGRTWQEVTMPKYSYSGIGSIQTPVIIGLKNGDAIISTTTYRDDLIPNVHTNGVLTRIMPNATAQLIPGNGNYVTMIQDATLKLWATTDNFSSSRESTDNGATWIETKTARPGFVFDSRNHFIAFDANYTFKMGTIGNTTTNPLTLTGFTSTSNAIIESKFDSQDRLHLLTGNKGLFIATTALP